MATEAGFLRVCDSCADLSQEPWAVAVDSARGALEALLRDRGNRREAATWLVEECSRGAFPVRSTEEKMRIVVGVLQDEVASRKLEDGPRGSAPEAKARAAQQLLALICEQTPQLVAPYFSSDADLLQSFFRGDARRVRLWFDHFQELGPAPAAAGGERAASARHGGCSVEGERAGAQGLEGHRLGARALARFVFRQRQEHWSLLCWRGRHAHSPVSVVARPHYLADLDVERTLEALLREAPDFWTSPELRAELRDGSFLAVDLPFFVGRLQRALHQELQGNGRGASSGSPSDPGSVLSLVRGFLATADFPETLQRVLPLADDAGLLGAANGVAAALSRRDLHSGSRRSAAAGGGKQGPGSWAARVRKLWESPVSVLELGKGRQWASLDELLLCCACVPGARQALRLLRDPEWAHVRAQAQEGTRALGLLLLGHGSPSSTRVGPGAQVPCTPAEGATRVCLASFAMRLALQPPALGEDAEGRERSRASAAGWASSVEGLLEREGMEFRREGGGSGAGAAYDLISDGEVEDRPERGAGKGKRRKDKRGKGDRPKQRRRRSEGSEEGVSGPGSRCVLPPISPAEGPADGGRSPRWRLALDGFEATWEAAHASTGGTSVPLPPSFRLLVQEDVVDLLAVLCFRSAAQGLGHG